MPKPKTAKTPKAETVYMAEHKVPAYELLEMTNKDPNFYSLLGPWLARREVVDELGSPVWDDDGKQWIIARGADGPIGMVAFHGGMVCSLYVATGQRGQLAGTTMVLRLVLRHGHDELRAIATESSKGIFEECGFKESGRRGRYYVMDRKATKTK
jgi:hypothetical protein